MENHNFYSKLSTQKMLNYIILLHKNEGEIIGKQYHFQFKLIIISKTYNNVYINGRYYCSKTWY